MVVGWVEKGLHGLNRRMPKGMAKNSLEGSWYLHPRIHAFEQLLMLSVHTSLLALVYFCSTPVDEFEMRPPSALDLVLGYAMLAIWGMMFCYKMASGFDDDKKDRRRTLFMFMPCHCITLLLAFVALNRSWATVYVGNALPYLLAFPIVALLTPDTRDYKLPGEIEGYYVQHFALVALPYVFYFEGVYPLWSFTWRTWLGVCAISSFVSYHVLTTVGIYTAVNINYMLSPPVGDIYLKLGKHYRIAVCVALYIGLLASRFLFGGVTTLCDVALNALGMSPALTPSVISLTS